MTVKKTSTVNPAENNFTFGSHLVSGYAKGTQIEIEWDEDGFNYYTGNDGEFGRALTNNRSATITLTLMQTSFSNDVLSDFHNQDLSNGNGIFECGFEDARGTTTLDGSGASITKSAPVTVSDTIEARTWVIKVGYLEGKVGGNFAQ